MDPKEKPYKFVVRLPTVLRNQIADAAKYYHRSMNSEIVARLERTFSGGRLEGRFEEIATRFPGEIELLFGRTLTEKEQKILQAYRMMPEEKQAALLELLH